MDDRQGWWGCIRTKRLATFPTSLWVKCGKQVGTCATCRDPETKEGIHAAWMPSFPDGMTRFWRFRLLIVNRALTNPTDLSLGLDYMRGRLQVTPTGIDDQFCGFLDEVIIKLFVVSR
jgi:hypothetical protein